METKTYKNGAYLLSKGPDEKVARLPLPELDAYLTELTNSQFGTSLAFCPQCRNGNAGMANYKKSKASFGGEDLRLTDAFVGIAAGVFSFAPFFLGILK